MNKALFLDRDGVVNVDTAYIHKAEDVVFVDGIFDLCKRAQSKGYLIIIVTNQAGIARGYYTVEDVEKLHAWMKDEFAKRGIKITDIFISPYHPKGVVPEYSIEHEDRKPKPGMFLKAAKKYDIDFKQSIMIGDKPSDRIEIDNLRCVILKSQYTNCDTAGFDIDSLSEILV